MFGNVLTGGDDNQIMKYMLMSQMFGGAKTGDMNSMLPMMFMMNGGLDNMFGGLFGQADKKEV